MSMRVEVVTITPELAAKWLKLHKTNRAVSEHNVKKYSDDMKNGYWKLNGEAIIFDEEGNLVNGRHRLNACIRSGVSFQSVVVSGVADDAFLTMDGGKKRTGGDVLSIKGEKCANLVSATLVVIHEYETGIAGRKVSNPTIVSLLERHPRVRESVYMAQSHVKLMRGILPGPIAAGAHYFCSQKDPILADKFFNALFVGANIGPGDPVFVLRNRLIEISNSIVRVPRSMLFDYIIKAWNATRTGQALRFVRMQKGEARPQVK